MKAVSRLARSAGARAASVGLAAAAVLLGACTQTPVTVTLHSLQASGSLSFVCQADDGVGLQLDECPDYEFGNRRLLGLVTQTATNEVAAVDLHGEAVVDLDPSIPGYTFARVGATPGAIVSTPGGVASFVGVSGLEKNGVFALPTTCLRPPLAGQQARDLTSWSACALSSAPGDIKLLVDNTAQTTCPPTVNDATTSTNAQNARECPADLSGETVPLGRRKLLVSLPEEHKLVLLDAQELLDQSPGQFRPCTVQATYPLRATLPTGPVVPVLPDDLMPTADAANTCQTTKYPPSTATDPKPGGMAVSGTSLYVADEALPVVHVVDVTDPCSPVEQKPLLPHSYEAPDRVVTTSRVAVSPLTPAHKQFVYAIDQTDPIAKSVMVFDVSPGVTNRTPVVFPGSPRQPYSPPDRLRYGSDVRDVAFVMRDFPAPDPTTGVGQFGVSCDPSPSTAANEPAAFDRPNSDYTTGARPPNLRGAFGFAMLVNGQIPIIDVEDFDEPCRQPILVNKSSTQDFRGCKPDLSAPAYFTSNGTSSGAPFATNESSCNVIEPNHTRNSALSISNSTVGLRAPTLRALPQFANPNPAALTTAQDQPRLLAVSFATPDPSIAGDSSSGNSTTPAQVNVSGQLYAACGNAQKLADAAATANGGAVPAQLGPPCDGSAQAIENDPTLAIANSLTLPLVEPRSYAGDESPSVTYEGRVLSGADPTSGFLQGTGDVRTLTNPDGIFCANGVEDSTTMLTEAAELGIPAANQAAWATSHADYVQITGDFLPYQDTYWAKGDGAMCAGGSPGGRISGHDACVEEFGDIDDLTALKNTRELTILNAFTDHLVVQSRNGTSMDDIHCCFPAGTAYTVRASHQWVLRGAAAGFLSDIAAGPGGSCVHTASCDPRKKFYRSRIFEVCDSSAAMPAGTADADKCVPTAANVGCVRAFRDPTGVSTGAIEPGAEGSACIFDGLTSRFVVYRGAKPSARDMSFTWTTTGGFTPLALSLLTQNQSVNPQSMVYIPELGYMAVVDGSSLGLTLFDLNSLGVVLPSPYF